MRRPRMPISLSIAPVQPEPEKITTVSSSPPTASRMIRAGVLAQPGGLQAGAAGLGVGVGVARQHLVADEVLDEGQRAPGRGVVGVGDPARAVGPVHDLVVADDGLADAAQQRRLGGRRGGAGRVADLMPGSLVWHCSNIGMMGAMTDAIAETGTPADPPVLVETSPEGVATVRLNRPEAMNALDVATKELLLQALQQVAEDPAVRCVVLTGSGRAFCVGQDLREHVGLLREGSDEAVPHRARSTTTPSSSCSPRCPSRSSRRSTAWPPGPAQPSPSRPTSG